MKNIVSIIALVAATASGASAATITATGDTDKPKWNGSIALDAIPDHCEFTYNNDTNGGSMDYDIDSGKWTTTSPATVVINHRGASELTVTNTGFLDRVGATTASNMAVVVDYTNSTLGSGSDGVLSFADTTKLSVGNLTDSSGIKSTTINIGGSAQMEITDVEINGIENGGQYQIVHTVNCIQ